MSDPISLYWRRFLEQRPAYRARQTSPEVDEFGDSPELADALVALILSGTKTATCSALAEYEHACETLPYAGQLALVVSSRGVPVCVREITHVEIARFCDVDGAFAYAEGEGDRTLASWRAEHQRFFSRLMLQLGMEFSEQMLLVCERFRVVGCES